MRGAFGYIVAWLLGVPMSPCLYFGFWALATSNFFTHSPTASASVRIAPAGYPLAARGQLLYYSATWQ